MDTNKRQYRRYNAVGRQITVRLIHHSDNSDPVAYSLTGVKEIFEHVLCDVDDADMVDLTIQYQVNQNYRSIGISFRRKDQLSGDVIWCVFGKVSI